MEFELELWNEEYRNHLTDSHGLEVKRLVRRFEDFRRSRSDVEGLLFEAGAVLNLTWEKLNLGKWTEVPEEKKQNYAIASFVKIVCLLHQNKPLSLEKSLDVADMGILLGAPFRSLSLTKVADVLSSKLPKQSLDFSERLKRTRVDQKANIESKRLRLANEVKVVDCPSLQIFRENFFTQNRPVKLTNCINHWPAFTLWKDLEYLVKKAGHRTVPVELGKHYADSSYSQKLMKLADFVEKFFKEDAEGIGYLAQHQLFDQVPELKEDITEPDYCAVTDQTDASGETEINAWFGPKGTVSPLHFDPKHNLLCQVLGSKKIVLFNQKYTRYLYPHDSALLFNTSRVDVENPDLEEFPDFGKATREECLLFPGEMLYIPPKYWHYVRSLENSFSVSFWWE